MDFELLITESEQRPAIWDPRDPKHCNRDLIKKYWSVALIRYVGRVFGEFP